MISMKLERHSLTVRRDAHETVGCAGDRKLVAVARAILAGQAEQELRIGRIRRRYLSRRTARHQRD